ncbi:hypothetical protein MP228_004670 [Amoeboaphelidium protococcarum]|nr:hypothetical protein MP228_004670 [Amoeboaphelidium protococcarum]
MPRTAKQAQIEQQDQLQNGTPKMTVQQLKTELKQKGLPTSGVKDELMQRYVQAMSEFQTGDNTEDIEDVVEDESESDDDLQAVGRYESWALGEVQSELKRRSLPTKGTKAKLIESLIADDLMAKQQQTKSDTAQMGSKLQQSSSNSLAKKVAKVEQKVLADGGTTKVDQELSLLYQPVTTCYYFVLALQDYSLSFVRYLLEHKSYLFIAMIIAGVSAAGTLLDNPYQSQFVLAESLISWYLWWIVLGVASSIGLGTGLHTFVLFLGPLIAEVTVFAYECPSLDFDLHGSDAFICRNSYNGKVVLLNVYKKIMFEALAWGIGTAIGELPPYFVARAAALAGQSGSGQAEEELDDIERLQKIPKSQRTVWDKLKLFMFEAMKKAGFMGILLCASIPNPLFDLAGITCGHFLVPFSTFFGATLIGKAFFKASLQTWSVIFVFSKSSLDKLLAVVKKFNPQLHMIISKFLAEQRLAFSRPSGVKVPNASTSSVISTLWNSVIFLMIMYFLQSIVVSIASAKRRASLSSQVAATTGKSDAQTVGTPSKAVKKPKKSPSSTRKTPSKSKK